MYGLYTFKRIGNIVEAGVSVTNRQGVTRRIPITWADYKRAKVDRQFWRDLANLCLDHGEALAVAPSTGCEAA